MKWNRLKTIEEKACTTGDPGLLVLLTRRCGQTRWPGLEAALVCGLWLCCTGWARAQSQPVDDLTFEQMSVRELMRLDTALALSQAKNKLDGKSKPGALKDSHGILAQGGGPRLIAIYGVGKKLMAEVLVGSHPFVYMHGRVLPIGLKSSETAFRLREITGSCIRLERKEEAHTLCLNPSMSTGG